jgi:alkylhydroperoxidase family enzyme
MSASPQSNRDRLLPGPDDRDRDGGSSRADGGRAERGRGRSGSAPARQLADLPRDELEHLAEEYGLDPTRYKRRQDLVAAIHDRRQMISSLDREAMLDVVRWGRRPVTANASKDQIAQEIARIRSMRFAGLSQRGLVVLARLRGVDAREQDDVPVLVKKLKRKEGFFGKLNRKRRSMVASWVARMIGGDEAGADYGYLPPAGQSSSAAAAAAAGGGRDSSLKQEIEESGLIGGITSRLKKTADSYVNQKLDEIESRIDRKLDEIDRRLAEWRDREIANRIRILKITLWASVLVGAFSLIYSYVVVYFFPTSRPPPGPRPPVPQQVAPK